MDWIKEFPASITVCDPDGVVLQMNDRSAKDYEQDGGYALVGTNLLDCHPAPARRKLEAIMAAREKNVYTIERNGAKKMIYQSPWHNDGLYAGFVEIALEIPAAMPHLIRS